MQANDHDGSTPTTLRAALAWAASLLAQHGVDSPRLTAELLLSHVLGRERARIISRPDDTLERQTEARFRDLARRRAAGEPLQYLTGEREFYGLTFAVGPAVLVPRPETEILVEKALQWAGACGAARPLRFADVGTGSGCIGISFARHRPHDRGWLVELSWEALAVARSNARRHAVESRLVFVCGDLLSCFAPRPVFDIILANPPYIPHAEVDALPATVRDYEPRMALDGGESGLAAYERLVPQAARCLADGGRIFLEVGAGQAAAVAAILEAAEFEVLEVAEDLQGIGRCVIGGRRRGA